MRDAEAIKAGQDEINGGLGRHTNKCTTGSSTSLVKAINGTLNYTDN